MSCITLDKVSFHYSSPFISVFKDLSINIALSWKTAITGKNGCGKTTLLKLINNDLHPVKGSLKVAIPTIHFPFVVQNIEANTMQVIKNCIAPFSLWEKKMQKLLIAGDMLSLTKYQVLLEKYEDYSGYDLEYRIKKEFSELQMSEKLLARCFRTLSGGERTRALIIALFLRRNRFVLLDEPTNHLDMKTRRRFAKYLAAKDGFLLVSHDRYFIDLCADHILSINKKDIRLHAGNYCSWKKQVQREEENEKRRKENLKREIKALEISSRKRRTWSCAKEKEKYSNYDVPYYVKASFSSKAAKQMKRALSLEKQITEKIKAKKSLLRNQEKKRDLKLPIQKKVPALVLQVANLSFSYSGNMVFQDFSLRIYRGERIAIIGRNGCGKTTLFKLLYGELQPHCGTIHFPGRFKFESTFQEPLWTCGYLKEHLLEKQLDVDRFRMCMACFGINGRVFERRLENFSDGQLKKIDLCRSFVNPTQLLFWDEPFNYIDLLIREQIEEAVLKSRPTLLFAEHDKYCVKRIASRVIEL
ncbi:ribosomal protection-like ABC-F family protein [Candidatus Riflebacteria bacterium]